VTANAELESADFERPGRSRWREPAATLPFGDLMDIPIDPDPLHPHPEHPTPPDLVLRLTRRQRLDRVRVLVDLAYRRYEEAIAVHCAGKAVAGVIPLVSGGNDSYTVAHLFRGYSTHWMHANTGTGIEATRQHVRATAARRGTPLIELSPPAGQGYWDIVRGDLRGRSRQTGEVVQAWAGGFPGPAAHNLMYQRLKERAIARIPHVLGISGARDQRAIVIAGRRRFESHIRATIPHHEAKGTLVWLSPIAVWHKADLRAYRLLHADDDDGGVPLNPVAQVLGMSGECGCLSKAVAGEVERWRAAYPTDPFLLQVTAMEAELAPRTDIPEHRKKWGWGADFEEPDRVTEPVGLCGPHCGPDPIWDAMDSLFDLERERAS
jgi:3'-phosphoadenosine 5'-phosphosulfate sulfotransferase (PAPS reductase)/FAD synthetase